MGLRIWIEKIMLALHIKRLDDGSLAGKVYREQKLRKWPGLALEVDDICDKLAVENVNPTKLSAKAYRREVVEACHKINEDRLRKQAEGKTKCDRIDADTYGKKSYISDNRIFNVRQMYKTRYGMLPFAGNYSKDKRFARSDWLCKCGEAKEEESHLLSSNCEVYGELRNKYPNLNNDTELVKFFNEVLDRRDRLEEEEKANRANLCG